MNLVRTYTTPNGKTYTCAGGCDVRGPRWEWRDEPLTLAEVNCPSCLSLLAKKGNR